MRFLGLDIGGASIKLADGVAFARQEAFALWQRPRDLGDVLHGLISESPPHDALAVTMTGELADCFIDKAAGVSHIVGSVRSAANDTTPVHVFLTDGSFVTPDAACSRPLEAAASNWLALSRWVAEEVVRSAGLLVDIGSTTTDIIRLVDGRVVARGRTDLERLASGELVYTGVRRTPVCAIVAELPFRRARCPVAAEVFATVWDAYLVLGRCAEASDRCDTADGRPATREHAERRLARMICADADQLAADDLRAMARHVVDSQVDSLADALRTAVHDFVGESMLVVVSGEGESLARASLEAAEIACSVVALSDLVSAAASRAAPAWAVARLASKWSGDASR